MLSSLTQMTFLDHVHGNDRCLVCEKLTLILFTLLVTSFSSSLKCGKDHPLIVKMTRKIAPSPWTFINLDSGTKRVHDFNGHNCGSWVHVGHDLNRQESLHPDTETGRHAEQLLRWYWVILLGLHRDPDLPKRRYDELEGSQQWWLYAFQPRKRYFVSQGKSGE